MLLGLIIIGIAAISVLLSYHSLKNDQKKHSTTEVSKKLAKGRVIFYAKHHHKR